MESLLGIFPDFSTELDEVRDLGDVTVTRHQLHGRGIGSDSPMDQTNREVAVRAIVLAISSHDLIESAGLHVVDETPHLVLVRDEGAFQDALDRVADVSLQLRK